MKPDANFISSGVIDYAGMFEKTISLTNAEFNHLERYDGKELRVELCLREAAGGLPKGRQSLDFGVMGTVGNVDRYAGQLRQFARIVRGEEKEPDGLCDHDIAVQRALLKMCGID